MATPTAALDKHVSATSVLPQASFVLRLVRTAWRWVLWFFGAAVEQAGEETQEHFDAWYVYEAAEDLSSTDIKIDGSAIAAVWSNSSTIPAVGAANAAAADGSAGSGSRRLLMPSMSGRRILMRSTSGIGDSSSYDA